MAIKRRPTDEDDDFDDEDDDDRPRSKRRPPDDRLRKPPRRSRDDEEEEDEDEDEQDEDRPPRRRKPRDEEDVEEPPRRKRRARDEDDEEDQDEEDDEDRPRRKRRTAGSDDDEEERDEEEEENEFDAWQRKQNEKRKYLIGAVDGLKLFKKQAKVYLYGWIGVLVSAVIFGVFLKLMPDSIILAAAPLSLASLVITVFVPVTGIMAAVKSKVGPPKLAESGLLTAVIVVNALTIFFGILLIACFVLALAFLRHAALYLKDRPMANKAKTNMIYLLVYTFIGGPLVGGIIFFLALMGMVGYILILAVVGIWATLVIKVFLAICDIADTLCITIDKKVARIDKPNW